LKNPEACATDDTGNGGNGGNTDCPDPKLCGLPLSDLPVTTPVPEPSTLWLMGAGIAALVAWRRARKLNSALNAST
jgi:hypothetical protein